MEFKSKRIVLWTQLSLKSFAHAYWSLLSWWFNSYTTQLFLNLRLFNIREICIRKIAYCLLKDLQHNVFALWLMCIWTSGRLPYYCVLVFELINWLNQRGWRFLLDWRGAGYYSPLGVLFIAHYNDFLMVSNYIFWCFLCSGLFRSFVLLNKVGSGSSLLWGQLTHLLWILELQEFLHYHICIALHFISII